jgi:hypothetical protein
MPRCLWVIMISILLVFPVSYPEYKYGLAVLAFLSLGIRIAAGRGRFALDPVLGGCFCVTIILGAFLVLYDITVNRDSPDLRVFSFWVLNPMIYLSFIFLSSGKPDLPTILDTSIYLASALISIDLLLYAGFSLFGLPYPLDFLGLERRFGLDESGFIALSSNNLPALSFFIPYVMADIFVVRRRRSMPRILTLVLSIAAAAASLRVAVLLSVVLSAVILFVIILRRRSIKRPFFLAAAASVSAILLMSGIRGDWKSSEIMKGIYSLKIADKVSGDDPRYEQLRLWMEYVSERPLLGHGLSSVDVTVYGEDDDVELDRSGPLKNPFGYELTYAKLLTEIGFLPFLTFTSLFLVLAAMLAKTWRQGDDVTGRKAIAHLMGMAMFVASSATNGYILTFGYMWTVMFPVAYMNNFLFAVRGRPS